MLFCFDTQLRARPGGWAEDTGKLSHQELRHTVQTASFPLEDAQVSAALGSALEPQLRHPW